MYLSGTKRADAERKDQPHDDVRASVDDVTELTDDVKVCVFSVVCLCSPSRRLVNAETSSVLLQLFCLLLKRPEVRPEKTDLIDQSQSLLSPKERGHCEPGKAWVCGRRRL